MADGSRDLATPRIGGVPPPVVVLGMHRSGTSLVVDVLDSLGVAMGRRRDPNGEALLFLELNRWLLAEAGGRWDRPAPARDLLADPELRSLSAERVRRTLRGLEAWSHVGWSALFRGIRGVRGPWGWKDPRNTFTLPLWLDLFPDARVVEVRRHGVDVAASLRRRTERTLVERRRLLERRGLARVHRHDGFVDSPRTRTLEGGFSLWEEYLDEARTHREQGRAGDRWLRIAFESLVSEPAEVRRGVARFLDLPEPTKDAPDPPAVRPGRAFGYRNDPGLRRFARSVAGRLRRRGYEA